MVSTLAATYDGRRRGREYVLLQPATAWGEKAYGLKPTDDYTFFPKDPQKGQKVDLRVSAETLRLLQLQRNIRQDNARAGRKRRWWPRR